MQPRRGFRKEGNQLYIFVSLSLAICISPLGLESGEIKDEALSIPDSSVPAHSKPEHIRLNMVITDYPFGWQARVAQTPPDYLQVNESVGFKRNCGAVSNKVNL